MKNILKVKFINENSHAEHIGIRLNDTIISYNGEKIFTSMDFSDAVLHARDAKKEEVEIIILRDKKEIPLTCSTEPLGIKLADEVEEEKENVDRDERILKMPFISSESFNGYRTIKTLGMARGSTVRAKHIGRDFMAEIKNLVGGELKGYTELLADGREEAIYRMKQDARTLGANALVSVRLTTSTITAGAAEVLAYGTAVIIKKENKA